MKKRYLALENGRVFEGYAFGSDREVSGEIVFTTGMCGYIETLTDPAVCSQIVLQTFPLIGNYGMIEEDIQSEFNALGYVVRNLCDTPSNFRCEYPLDEFLKKRDIPGIYGVDTREITKILKKEGSMKAFISDSPEVSFSDINSYIPSTKEKYTVQGGSINIAVLDLGIKKSLTYELTKRGASVTVYPYNTSAKEILSSNPDGILLSSGAESQEILNGELSDTIKELFASKPVLAVGIGHLALAKALGYSVAKLPHGHRGANQPSKDLLSGKTYVTEQCHGYAVLCDSIKSGTLRFTNVNDGSCEGIMYENAISVQFYPGSETAFIYDEFMALMGGNK